MTRQLLDHVYSVVVVIAVFIVILKIAATSPDAARQSRESAIAPYLDLDILDYGSPLDRAILKEALTTYYPGEPGLGDSLLAAIDAHRREAFTNPALKAGAEKPGLTPRTLARLAPMYVQFVLLYAVVLVLTVYGARMMGTFRFIRTQQRRLPALLEFLYTAAGDAKRDTASGPHHPCPGGPAAKPRERVGVCSSVCPCLRHRILLQITH